MNIDGPAPSVNPTVFGQLREKANAEWHLAALRVFLAIVLLHWAEHLAQAIQVYVFRWPIPEARGLLGRRFPWLISSEWLHYAYALVMLAGIGFLLPGFAGRARHAWAVALAIQFWHHFEHALLLVQALVGKTLTGGPAPVSIIQLWVPRVELHLFYNSIVFIPMLVALWYHKFPNARESKVVKCRCQSPSVRVAA